jgi:polyisoprenoid-binding protein YceI
MIMKNISKKNFCYYGLALAIVLLISSCLTGKKDYNMRPTSNGADVAVKAATELSAGTYKLDRSHASLIFRVNHMGLSRYNVRFKRFDAQLQLDPKNPAEASVTASVDPTSIETDYPDPKKINFNAVLQGSDWLNAKEFNNITFRSNKVELTGANTARIHGQLTMHGITLPLTLYTMFNGGYASNPMDPEGSRIGFSARGFLNRSDFGISYGIPVEGSNMGVGDVVEFAIEAEFVKPVDVMKIAK